MIHMQRAPDRAKLIISIVFIARYSIFHTCIYVPLCTYMYVNDHIYISMCVYVHNPDTLSRNCFRTIATRGNATHSPRRLPRSSPSASPEKSRGTGSPCSARFCGPGGRGGGVGEKRVSAALRGEQSRSVTGARGMEGGNAYSPGQAQLEVHGVREHHEGLVPSVLAAAARGQQHVEHGQTPEEDEDVLGPGAVREAAEARAGEGSQQALERVEGGRGEIRPVGALAEEARVVGVALAGAGGLLLTLLGGGPGSGGGRCGCFVKDGSGPGSRWRCGKWGPPCGRKQSTCKVWESVNPARLSVLGVWLTSMPSPSRRNRREPVSMSQRAVCHSHTSPTFVCSLIL